MPGAPIANLLNALVLITMPIWAYLTSDNPSFTALIPAGFGLALILCQPGVKSENKAIAHVAVLLTLVVLVALVMPMRGAIGREDPLAIVRVGLMMLTSVVAMIAFIRSFIAARKAREAAGG